ncbi:MAG TPA: ferredoxin--NADP reductase [Casimicrobiaceae bacterium]
MSVWIEGRVARKKRWTPGLLSLEVHAPDVSFVAGQFARLALPAAAGAKEPMIGRPYSFVNAPGAPNHEFYFNVVPEGPFSPRLALLEPGESLWLAPRANGFFCVGEAPSADVLWCLSTGTGIGPFLSILRTPEPWVKFSRIVLVHAVRVSSDLTYRELMSDLTRQRNGAFTYVPVVSREAHPDAMKGRIPLLVDDGTLETRVGLALTADNSHTMLCGNPAMVDDVQAVLLARGMKRHRRKEPGHVTVETYW